MTAPCPPHAVFFDAGATLIHPDPKVIRAHLDQVGVHNASITDSDLLRALVAASEARHRPFPRAPDGEGKVATDLAQKLELPKSSVRGLVDALRDDTLYGCVDPEATATLDSLQRAGVRLGVISNSAGTVQEDLQRHGLAEYFEVVVDSSLVGIEKPDARIFRHAADRIGLPEPSCWHVGDGLVNDALGAAAARFGMGLLYDRFDAYGELPSIPRISRLTQVCRQLEQVPTTDRE